MSTVLICSLVMAGIFILLAIGYINHIVEKNRIEKARQRADLTDRLRRCEVLSETLPGQMMSPALKALLAQLQLDHAQKLLALDKSNNTLSKRTSELQSEVAKGESIAVNNPPQKFYSEAMAKDVRFQLETLEAQIVHATQKHLINAQQARHWSGEIQHFAALMHIELYNNLGLAALQQDHPGQARLAFERGVQYLRKMPDSARQRYQQALQTLETQLERANALVLKNTHTQSGDSSELTEGMKALEGDDLWKKKAIYD